MIPIVGRALARDTVAWVKPKIARAAKQRIVRPTIVTQTNARLATREEVTRASSTGKRAIARMIV